MGEDREVLREVWSGRIPTCFTLAPRSPESTQHFGSTEIDPFYLMLPRLSYINLVTEKVRKHFSRFLIATSDLEKEDMWFSDKSTGLPLKLHLPVGVLFDQKVIGSDEESPRAPDELTSEQHHHQLPWSISVHFGNFPDTQIIKFESRELMESYFLSCIKEADQIKHGGRVVSTMQKKDHNQLWQGLQNDKFDQFWAVNRRLMENKNAGGASGIASISSGATELTPETANIFKHIPVRLYLCQSTIQDCRGDTSSQPLPVMRQKLIKPIVKTVKVSEESERVSQSSGGGDLPSSTEASDLPPTDGVRLATLRDLINQMVTDKSYQEVKVITQGISPEWDTPLQWMSEHLSYPDNFLHICVR